MNLEEQKAHYLEAYDAHADILFRHCYFKLSDREAALDVTQETFTRVWERILDNEEIKNMRAFLFRIANNLIIDRYRKKKTYSLDALRDDGFDIADESPRLADMLDGKRALALVKTLESSYRDVIILRYVDDLSLSEIADILNLTENAISVRIHRGIKQLQALYARKESHSLLADE